MNEAIAFTPRLIELKPSAADTVIVTTNHLGADMKGDAGLDAQYLANVSGHTVIGLNRLGSGDDATFSKSLAKRITNSPEDVVEEWASHLIPELSKRSPSKVQLVGRSAGANLMLHAAALELIPNTTGILAIEALRFKKIPTRMGQLKYIDYQIRHEGKFKASKDEIVDPDLKPNSEPRPSEAANPRMMLNRQLVDIRHSQHLWASDLPFRNALRIASSVRITGNILLAEDSMAAESEDLVSLLAQIDDKREDSNIGEKFVAEVIKKTTHGSFDDQRLYATCYRRFARLLTT